MIVFVAERSSTPRGIAIDEVASGSINRRLTTKQTVAGRLAYLDGWRAVAIGGVFLDHFGTSRGLNAGRLGVELFFVLSGRLMGQILFVEKTALGKFYYRRFSRVWPTMAALIACLALGALALHRHGLDILDVATGLTYTYNYAAVLGHRNDAIDHLWSLCIEEHTYLFLGVSALLARRHERLLWPLLMAAILVNVLDGAVSTYLLRQDYYEVYWRTDVRMASILLGVATFLAKRQGHLQLSGAWPLVVGLLGVALNLNGVPDPVKYSLGTLCLALFISNIEADSTSVKRLLSYPAMAWLGLVSYSLYIWQQPFAALYAHSLASRIGLGVAALAAGVVSFYSLESPLRVWLNRHPPGWARPRAG